MKPIMYMIFSELQRHTTWVRSTSMSTNKQNTGLIIFVVGRI